MKDPAVLFYISDWLTSTSEMDADARGWYLNLILHNYDKKSLPNDIEKLAVLAGVKFSEFDRFKQVFEQVFEHKFEQNEEGRLINQRTSDILEARERFQDKRSEAGKKSYLMKYMAKNYSKEYRTKKIRDFVKDNFERNIDLKNEQMLEQMFEHLFELYRNENGIGNKSDKVTLEERKQEFKLQVISKINDVFTKDRAQSFFHYWSEHNEGGFQMKFEMEKTWNLTGRIATWVKNNKTFVQKKKDGKLSIEEYREQFFQTQSQNLIG